MENSTKNTNIILRLLTFKKFIFCNKTIQIQCCKITYTVIANPIESLLYNKIEFIISEKKDKNNNTKTIL